MSQLIAAFTLWQTFTTAIVEVTQPPTPPGCGADAREPNNERRRAKSARSTPIEGRTCSDDPDWFYFRVTAGERLEVRVEHGPTAWVHLDLFAPRKRTPVAPATHGPQATSVHVQPRATGTYRIRIHADGPTPTTYVLRVLRTGVRKRPRPISVWRRTPLTAVHDLPRRAPSSNSASSGVPSPSRRAQVTGGLSVREPTGPREASCPDNNAPRSCSYALARTAQRTVAAQAAQGVRVSPEGRAPRGSGGRPPDDNRASQPPDSASEPSEARPGAFVADEVETEVLVSSTENGGLLLNVQHGDARLASARAGWSTSSKLAGPPVNRIRPARGPL